METTTGSGGVGMDDSIKLAEAMGWPDNFFKECTLQVNTGYPEKNGPWIDAPGFFPFTDANDDYAVLEWMRPEDWINSVPIKGAKHVAWRDFIFELRLLQIKDGRETSVIGEGYKIGDYARSALEELNK